MEITSLQNEKVKYWKKLNNKKYRDIEKLFLVEGDHLVKEAIKNKVVKEIITIDSEDYEYPTYHVTKEIMNELSNQVTKTDIIAVCYFLEERNILGNVVILDNLQDPGNLGTIIRSAVAFNFDTIVLSKDSVSKYNDKVIRSSEGMIFNINIIERDLLEFIPTLKDYEIISTDVNIGSNIKDIKFDKVALIIGSEGSGVSPEVSKLATKLVNIKMNSNCESLNAGVSASILMYEVNNG